MNKVMITIIFEVTGEPNDAKEMSDHIKEEIDDVTSAYCLKLSDPPQVTIKVS